VRGKTSFLEGGKLRECPTINYKSNKVKFNFKA